MSPDVSVVVATHNRPDRLARLLDSLRAQTLAPERFEVIVVDDASGPETAAMLERQPAGLQLTVLRHERSTGPSRARNDGWRAARGALVAFTDDDCEASPGWLEAGLSAWAGDARRFVQGPVLPDPAGGALDHFTHTLNVVRLGPWWETANMFYPRAALEAVGGFDEVVFPGPSAEDTDLGWKLIEADNTAVWAPEATIYHAVTRLTPRAKLRLAWRWHESMLVFKRHPQLREHLRFGLFWIPAHWALVRAIIGLLLLPKGLRWASVGLATPYARRVGTLRPHVYAFLVVHDAVEMGACARGSARYRVFVL